jgi:hypothetical protein
MAVPGRKVWAVVTVFLESLLQWDEETTSHSVNALRVEARQRFRPFVGIRCGEEAARGRGRTGCVGCTRGLTEAGQQCTGLRSWHIEAMVRHW